MATKKYNNQKVKLNGRAIAILIIALVLVVSVFTFTNLPSKKDKVIDTYSNLTSTHVFEKISYSKFVKLAETEENFFVFYGKKDCDACQDRVVDVNSLAEQLNVNVIYYLDANSLNDEQKSELYNTYGVKKNFTPQLVAFEDGAKALGTYEDMFGKKYDESLDTKENFKTSVSHVLNCI